MSDQDAVEIPKAPENPGEENFEDFDGTDFIQAEIYLIGKCIGGKVSYSDQNAVEFGAPFGTYLEVAVDNLLSNIRKEAFKVIRAKYGEGPPLKDFIRDLKDKEAPGIGETSRIDENGT